MERVTRPRSPFYPKEAVFSSRFAPRITPRRPGFQDLKVKIQNAKKAANSKQKAAAAA